MSDTTVYKRFSRRAHEKSKEDKARVHAELTEAFRIKNKCSEADARDDADYVIAELERIIILDTIALEVEKAVAAGVKTGIKASKDKGWKKFGNVLLNLLLTIIVNVIVIGIIYILIGYGGYGLYLLEKGAGFFNTSSSLSRLCTKEETCYHERNIRSYRKQIKPPIRGRLFKIMR